MDDRHDSWKDSYDDWKLANPYDDDDYGREEYCNHEEFEIDWEGLAHCDNCRATWWATLTQIANQERHEREYAEHVAEEHRRAKWLKLTAPFRWLWYRLFNPVSPRIAIKALDDDEIPF